MENKPTAGTEHFDKILANVEDRILFKGKTMTQWASTVVLPPIDELLDEDALAQINRRAIELMESIYSNVASAKGFYTASKSSYNRKLNDVKESILSQIENDNAIPGAIKKKPPTADMLETLSYNRCLVELQAYTIAELFYDFWNYQTQKIQLFNTRLTSLNIGKHHELKNSQGF